MVEGACARIVPFAVLPWEATTLCCLWASLRSPVHIHQLGHLLPGRTSRIGIDTSPIWKLKFGIGIMTLYIPAYKMCVQHNAEILLIPCTHLCVI